MGSVRALVAGKGCFVIYRVITGYSATTVKQSVAAKTAHSVIMLMGLVVAQTVTLVLHALMCAPLDFMVGTVSKIAYVKVEVFAIISRAYVVDLLGG